MSMKLAKFLIAKSLKLGPKYLISVICMLLLACRIFQQTISNWRSFWRTKKAIL